MTVVFRQGAGRLCLDFVRTLRLRGKPGVVEELPDAAALAEWVRQCGPAEPTGVPDFVQVKAAQELREAFFRADRDRTDGDRPPGDQCRRARGRCRRRGWSRPASSPGPPKTW
ncbi:ABATE domain-containing protein [Fodinicola feengrottensis]|uniref:ABATE domain-containing protein n=1 Tax=Fodinicola feengrottensis TaxID=435914 RepID=UPI0036F2F107